MLVTTEYVSGDQGSVALVSPDGSVVRRTPPSNVYITNRRMSMAIGKLSGKYAVFMDGGASESLTLTNALNLVRTFLPAPSYPIVDGAPAGGEIGLTVNAASVGPTGLCVFYVRWYDSTHNRLSGLSAASLTQNLDGTESITLTGIPNGPAEADPFVDKVQVWMSRNGAAIRRLATRDIGAASITITETVEYEAETVEGLQKAPMTFFNAMYHDRRWMAGDPNNPDRLYYTPPERLGEFAGGYLVTRQGEAITGIATIRDVLVVFCAKSSYYVSGYSESDFEMRTLEPSIGCLTHHGIKMVHDVAFVPAHLGVYACTGTSMQLLSGEYSTLWNEMYSANPLAFELGFAINDERGRVYKFFEEDVTVSAAGVPTYGTGRYWVLDYKNFSPQEGGFSAPLLSFDLHAARPKCAAMVAAPGGRAGDLYTAFTDIAAGEANRIVKENVWTAIDVVGDYTAIIQPSMAAYEPDGGPWDGLTAVEGWILVNYEDMDSWLLEMLHGPDRAAIRSEYSWALNTMFGIPLAALPASGGGREITPGWASWTPANTTEFQPASLAFKIGLTGEGFCPRLAVVNPIGLVWAGWGATLDAGKAYLATHV